MTNSLACLYSSRLIDKLKLLDVENKLDNSLINKAIFWAQKYHDGQFRKSGEPFYSHPLEVAYMISDHLLKTDVIVASILHDIVEDTEVTVGMILDTFGRRIAEMVDRLTRDRPDGTKLSVELILNNAYKHDDKEVLLIKIIDRLHNISTVEALPPEKQKKQVKETIKNFLILLEELSLNELSTFIYNRCTQLNINLGVIQSSDIKVEQSVFNEKSILPAP